MESTYIKKEKINSDIKPEVIRVLFKTTDGLKKSGFTHVKLKFQVNETLQLVAKFDIHKDG